MINVGAAEEKEVIGRQVIRDSDDEDSGGTGGRVCNCGGGDGRGSVRVGSSGRGGGRRELAEEVSDASELLRF